MSRVPWSTFARCRVSLTMVDIRPPMKDDGRHSTVDLSTPEFLDYMSSDDFSRSALSNGLMVRIAAPSGVLTNRNLAYTGLLLGKKSRLSGPILTVAEIGQA